MLWKDLITEKKVELIRKRSVSGGQLNTNLISTDC